ncbi:MAG: hypothetical protein SNJ74_02700 [Fimbriimonadaceae bacterium]
MKRKAALLAAALLTAVAAIVGGCGAGDAAQADKQPRREGGHIRVLNTTDEPVAVVFGRRRLGDQIDPGDANLFQKEVPGRNAFVIGVPGSMPMRNLAEKEVELKSGTTTTYVLRKSGNEWNVVTVENEPRFADQGSPTVTVVSLDPVSAVDVALQGQGRKIELGRAEGFGIRETKPVPPGLYRLVVGGKTVGPEFEIREDVAYSAFVFTMKGAVSGSVHRNTPAMSIQGIEGAAGAGG